LKASVLAKGMMLFRMKKVGYWHIYPMDVTVTGTAKRGVIHWVGQFFQLEGPLWWLRGYILSSA